MQSKVKLTKRQMKEDKFTTFMLTSKDKFQSELEDKWQYYVIGLVVVVVLIAATVWHFDRQAVRGLEAAQAYARAVMSYQAGDEQVAILEFNQVLEDYGSSDVAASATFLLGNLNLSTRNYVEASRHYQAYLDGFAGNPLNRAASYSGMAAAQENQGQYIEAAATFMLAVGEYPGGPLEPDYELGAIRNYLASGNIESAEVRLANLEENYVGTEWAKRASRLISEKRAGE